MGNPLAVKGLRKTFCHRLFFVFAMLLSMFLFCFCFCQVLKLHSFNSQLHSALSVGGYHDLGQDIGKYCPLPEPIRLQDSQDIEKTEKKKSFVDQTQYKKRARKQYAKTHCNTRKGRENLSMC